MHWGYGSAVGIGVPGACARLLGPERYVAPARFLRWLPGHGDDAVPDTGWHAAAVALAGTDPASSLVQHAMYAAVVAAVVRALTPDEVRTAASG